MKIEILPSSPGAREDRQYLSTYLVNRRLAFDAGSLGLCGAPAEQARVRHVFLTHTHADHIASLPIFLENVFGLQDPCVVVHAARESIACLEGDVFNNRLWPDFVALGQGGPGFLELRALDAEQPIEVEGLRVTPVPVHHTVPAFGFIVEDGNAAAIFAGDSGPTERLWELARSLERPPTVFLEASFPSAMHELAAASLHLTPQLVAAEVAKLPIDSKVRVVHIKTRYRAEVIAELEALSIPGLTIAQTGVEYAVY